MDNYCRERDKRDIQGLIMKDYRNYLEYNKILPFVWYNHLDNRLRQNLKSRTQHRIQHYNQ